MLAQPRRRSCPQRSAWSVGHRDATRFQGASHSARWGSLFGTSVRPRSDDLRRKLPFVPWSSPASCSTRPTWSRVQPALQGALRNEVLLPRAAVCHDGRGSLGVVPGVSAARSAAEQLSTRPVRFRNAMSIQELGSLGELISSVAVVVTLVMLIYQLRENTKAIESESVRRAADANFGLFVRSPDLRRVMAKIKERDGPLPGVAELADRYSLDLEDAELWFRYQGYAFAQIYEDYQRGADVRAKSELLLRYPDQLLYWRHAKELRIYDERFVRDLEELHRLEANRELPADQGTSHAASVRNPRPSPGEDPPR